ncbi:hypothetical protein [Vibrio salinus]|uniref:hypothetical protein n=1 Tax=Vibrio salinus TaxID=2899784 RepID=UPI001E4A5186|nr:hypothetical protein [Vibrio salinus]MCE0492537.1 hypothetical protein [Vibrio salinus]
MPAEKLTLSRFIHIIILFIVLITAFIWRTLTTPDVHHFKCKNRDNCATSFEGEKIHISSQNNTFTISISRESPQNSVSFVIDPAFEKISSLKYEMTFVNKKPVKNTIVFKSDKSSLIIHLPKDG